MSETPVRSDGPRGGASRNVSGQAGRPAPRRGRRNARRRALLAVARLGIVVVLLAAWQVGVNAKVVDPFFWGEPTGVVGRAGHLGHRRHRLGLARRADPGDPGGGRLRLHHRHASASSSGSHSAGCGFLAELFGAFIKVANSIPRIVLGVDLHVAFGLGIQSKVILAVVLVFFGVFFNAFQGTREVDRNLSPTLASSAPRHGGHPAGRPALRVHLDLASLHVSFGFALIGAIVGEFLGANKGLGLLIRSSQSNFNMNGVLAGMVLVADHRSGRRGSDHPAGEPPAALASSPATTAAPPSNSRHMPVRSFTQNSCPLGHPS